MSFREDEKDVLVGMKQRPVADDAVPDVSGLFLDIPVQGGRGLFELGQLGVEGAVQILVLGGFLEDGTDLRIGSRGHHLRRLHVISEEREIDAAVRSAGNQLTDQFRNLFLPLVGNAQVDQDGERVVGRNPLSGTDAGKQGLVLGNETAVLLEDQILGKHLGREGFLPFPVAVQYVEEHGDAVSRKFIRILLVHQLDAGDVLPGRRERQQRRSDHQND